MAADFSPMCLEPFSPATLLQWKSLPSWSCWHTRLEGIFGFGIFLPDQSGHGLDSWILIQQLIQLLEVAAVPRESPDFDPELHVMLGRSGISFVSAQIQKNLMT